MSDVISCTVSDYDTARAMPAKRVGRLGVTGGVKSVA